MWLAARVDWSAWLAGRLCEGGMPPPRPAQQARLPVCRIMPRQADGASHFPAMRTTARATTGPRESASLDERGLSLGSCEEPCRTGSASCSTGPLELNRSLHRAEILPYDVIARRTEATLANIAAYLGLDIIGHQLP